MGCCGLGWDLSSFCRGASNPNIFHFSVVVSFLENSAKDKRQGGHPGPF